MTDAKLVRFAAVVVVLAGYVFVFRGGEDRITERLDENARIAGRVRAGELALASRPRFEADRTRLFARLHSVELDAGRSAQVARFLSDAARIAVAHHAAIPTITAAGVAAPVSIAPNATNEPLESIPLEITVEGRYADVLATMRALSRSRVLAAVDVASLARKHADGPDATLTATLHVALERRAPAQTASPAGTADVRAGRG